MKRKGIVVVAGFIAALAGINMVMVPRLMAADVPQSAAPDRQVSGRFLLETHDGHRVTNAAFNGSLRLMAFGYTFCPDICPTALGTMAAAMDLLGKDAEQVFPIFVSVDPQRDTHARMKEYVGSFGPRFVGLTGTPAMVEGAARQFNVVYEIQPPAKGDAPDSYVVDHSAGIYLMGRKGEFIARLAHTATAAELAERVRQVLASER